MQKNNFDIVLSSSFPERYYSNADGKFLSWLEKIFSIGTGRRRACNEAGLSGAEKRNCVRQLKKSGWKKGQPIPADMAGVTHKDVLDAEKYPPLPIYNVTPYTAVMKEDEELGLYTYYPQPNMPDSEPKGGEKSAWEGMGTAGQVITIVGASGLIALAIAGINRMVKNKNKTIIN